MVADKLVGDQVGGRPSWRETKSAVAPCATHVKANGDALPPPPPVDQPGLVALGQGFESKTIVAEGWMSRSARSARSAR